MTKKDTSLDDIASAIGDLATHIDVRFEQVNKRLDNHDQQFSSINTELYAIRKEQREMKEWLERIDSRILGIESDIKEIYDRIVALEQKGPYLTRKEAKELEQKLIRMFDWAKKVSQKTGIALPKL